MDWEREKRKDERFANCILIVALVAIALGIVFQPSVYPMIANLADWFEELAW